MKVLLLAGGLGTRLSEETDLKPKPMVEIGGKPILWHIMKTYSQYGFNEFVVLLGYKGYLIKEYFANYFLHQSDVTIDMTNGKMEVLNNSSEPWKITLLDTGIDSMTGGRVKRAQNFIGDEPFMLTYGDGVSDVNIEELVKFHKSHGKAMTMTSAQPEGRFGALNIKENNQVTHFLEKPKGDGGWINAGFFVCEPKVFDYITEGDGTVFEQSPLQNLAKDGEIFTYKHEGFWKPMDSLKDKNDLNALWNANKAPLEKMVMRSLFNGIYKDKTVLLTGHTGFKGSWLAYWLKEMGANVIGYSLEAPTQPNHLGLLDLHMESVIGDIRDQDALDSAFAKYRPEIVFHLAAQPLVRLSYEQPVETYETNVIGTLKVLEACRKCDAVKAIVNITSDKAYENKEWVWGYRENDPMGGYDPYSASKGCAELVVSSYRNSYFNLNDYGTKHNVLLASCRAGNVIGGGDWAQDRLMTDIMVSVSQGNKVKIRNPYATRPWQHVLEPLSGYLAVGQKLLEGKKEFAEGWNFGPSDEGSVTVQEVVENVKKHWDKIDYELHLSDEHPHEANLLKLDCSKAHIQLHWKDVWNTDKTFEKTVNWYKAFYETSAVLTKDDLECYIADAKAKKIEWAQN